MRLRSLAATLSVLLAFLLLAGCGGGGDDEGETTAAVTTAAADNAIAVAAEDTRGAGSSKVELTATVPVAPGQDPVELTGAGEFDYEARRGRLTFDFGALLGSLGAGDGATQAEILLDGSVAYLNLPLLTELLPGGKPWIKVDLDAAAASEGFDLGQLAQAGQNDPSQFFAYLTAADGVEEVGTETVRGEETTHYRATVDLERAAAQAPPELAEQIQKAVDQIRQTAGKTTVPVDVWIGDDGLIRRVTFDYSSAETEPPVESTITMELFDFGVDVTVEPPPADQVMDASELGGLLGGGSDGDAGSGTSTAP